MQLLYLERAPQLQVLILRTRLDSQDAHETPDPIYQVTFPKYVVFPEEESSFSELRAAGFMIQCKIHLVVSSHIPYVAGQNSRPIFMQIKFYQS